MLFKFIRRNDIGNIRRRNKNNSRNIININQFDFSLIHKNSRFLDELRRTFKCNIDSKCG
jgi:hypothetical protein